jgi:hypothetical protein
MPGRSIKKLGFAYAMRNVESEHEMLLQLGAG